MAREVYVSGLTIVKFNLESREQQGKILALTLLVVAWPTVASVNVAAGFDML
jgi:hypothetical protein